ncbi:MAG: DUF3472 domain-containing protein [Bacteroidales bacterium]|nr:DUF3472 domain-containing protein [Bacteroidales bacterium]
MNDSVSTPGFTRHDTSFLMRFLSIGALTLVLGVLPAYADKSLEGKACRSVHLGYPGDRAVAFYNEVTVQKSAEGTYFCACGWDKGYFGIQEQSGGKKVVIFSVWDSGQNDPKAVAEDRQVKLLHKHPKVRTGRFGGEGTGGQSFLDFNWKVGNTYRFIVHAKPDGQRTEYSGYFFAPEVGEWMHLITFSTITGGKKDLGGYYSFVEDFKRNRVSLTQPRVAQFNPVWTLNQDRKWSPILTARFTGDSNPAENIDAGMEKGRFFLKTGGDTQNTHTKLGQTMSLPQAPGKAPQSPLPRFPR